MMGKPTNNKMMQEKMKKKTMSKYGNDKKVAAVSKNVKKMMGEEMAEKKMKPMAYARKEKGESMRKEAMENMAERKAKMAMKPSMMRGRLLA